MNEKPLLARKQWTLSQGTDLSFLPLFVFHVAGSASLADLYSRSARATILDSAHLPLVSGSEANEDSGTLQWGGSCYKKTKFFVVDDVTTMFIKKTAL